MQKRTSKEEIQIQETLIDQIKAGRTETTLPSHISHSILSSESNFSAYKATVQNIYDQYILWKRWQDKLQEYAKQHKTAESALQSIGLILPSSSASNSGNIYDSDFDLQTTQKILEQGINLIQSFKITTQEIGKIISLKQLFIQDQKREYEKVDDFYNEARMKHSKMLGDLKLSISERDRMIGIFFASILAAMFIGFSSTRSIDIIAAQVIQSSIVCGSINAVTFNFISNKNKDDNIKTIISALLSVSFSLFFMSQHLNESRLICLVSLIIYSFIFISFMSILKKEKFIRGLSPDLHSPELSPVKRLSKSIEKEFTTREYLKKSICQLENQLEEYISSSERTVSEAHSEILSKLNYLSKCILLAHHFAQDEMPFKFGLLRDKQKEKLSQILTSWEYANGNSSSILVRPWHEINWQFSYHPPLDGKAPECICAGQFLIEDIDVSVNQVTTPIKVPAMVPIRAIQDVSSSRLPGHIVIFSDTKTRKKALRALESLSIKLLSTFPVRTLKASFVDPVALGDTFPFKGLPKSILSGQQIFTRNQDIREELKNLVTHVEQIIQNYLGRNYETIEDYNADSQAIIEAYRYLFIADFPAAFNDHTAEELKSLITNGSRAGVYTVIHVDTSQEELRAFDYSIFEQYCTVIYPTDQTHNGEPLFRLQMPDGWERDLILDSPPSQEVHQHIIQSIIAAEKTIKVETVPFSKISPTTLWQANSQQELRAPIGLTGAREHVEFWLGENDEKITVSSGLLAGKPGAGKSYTLHSIILSLAMQYSPDELELYLLDYKEGVEFQIYVDPNRADTSNPTAELDETRALPHAKVISIESDREFGLSVLQSIQQEIEMRGQLFKNVGVSELKDYRQKTGQQLPRILVVIDEFQYMFQDNDPITRDLNQLYEDITRRGRSFGVHLLLASQSLNIANINSRIYGFIPLRMAMQMDQTTAGIVLAEGNTDAVELLDRSGRIIYNTEFGRKRQNQLGQIADISLEERRNAMNQIYQQSETTHYQRSQPLTIFQGNRPSKISQNGQLLNLAKLDKWLSSSAINKQIIHSQDWISQESPGALWLGEAMRIGHHSHAILRRRTRSNMLLIGQSEQSIFGILSGALLSLVHIYKPNTAEFHIIDLAQTDDDEALSEMTHTFRQEFQDLYPIKLGKRFPDSAQDIKRSETILTELYEELQRRKQIRNADPDAMNFGPSVFFIAAIGALNRAQNLRPIAGKRADEMSPDAQKFQEIVTIGPELGIHTILWFDNAKTFQQMCAESSPRNLLMQFDCRAVLHLPGEDSRLFLGEPIAEKLPALRAYYYDAGLSTGFEKFKPYAIPSASEIQRYAQNLKQRQS
jgi:DNA segregation ATPase FtsK/SpoIIIE, S-DNA-T family